VGIPVGLDTSHTIKPLVPTEPKRNLATNNKYLLIEHNGDVTPKNCLLTLGRKYRPWAFGNWFV